MGRKRASPTAFRTNLKADLDGVFSRHGKPEGEGSARKGHADRANLKSLKTLVSFGSHTQVEDRYEKPDRHTS